MERGRRANEVPAANQAEELRRTPPLGETRETHLVICRRRQGAGTSSGPPLKPWGESLTYLGIPFLSRFWLTREGCTASLRGLFSPVESCVDVGCRRNGKWGRYLPRKRPGLLPVQRLHGPTQLSLRGLSCSILLQPQVPGSASEGASAGMFVGSVKRIGEAAKNFPVPSLGG